MEQEISRIKYICRMKEGRYTRQLLVNNADYTGEMTPELAQAEQFLEAFAPQTLTQEGTEAFGEGFVLVFRTDTSQMQAYAEALAQL